MADDAAKPNNSAPEPGQEAAAQPKRLGGFELLGRLGKGGMGTVLKARQVSMDRLVALKILPKKLAENDTFVQRFLREARSAAKLRHPNIVQAFDVGQADGYYFFAMEFVDGETLADVVRRDGPMEPDRALDAMKQVASALAAAHKEGIVHRDIKPSNIMVDKEGQVRVTDFGLAKRTEGDVEVTADGSVVGTPAYVAPEMAKGGDAEPRSDLYSLGATFFCALAGRPPFEGKNFSEVLIKQVNETPPPLASLAPRVDRRLCHIVDRLLRKNPEARYPSATALIDDLNGLGKLQSVAAAARAEGRALIAESPTLEMSEGQRRMRDFGGPRPARSSKTTLIAVGAIVAILAVAGIVLATRGPKGTATKPPSSVPQPPIPAAKPPVDAKKTSVPQPPTPTTQPPTPAVKTPPVVVVDDAEAKRKAAELAEAERVARAKEEAAEKARLEAEELRRQAEAALAAYQAESDKLWALFKARDYAAADKLLAALNLPRVENPREVMAADLEAAKLLKEFWATVEKGVAARKGTISVEGALGNVAGVENGVITLQTAKGPVTRRIEQLTAKQALAYAAVAFKDDDRSHLAEAIFRIAEAEDAVLADKALAAAGNPPGLAYYKDRLAALTLGAAEVAARRAWAEIEATAKPKPTKAEAQRLIALLDAFEKAHANTKHFAAVREKLADLRAQAQPGPKPAEWINLFDGKTLQGWSPVEGGRFSTLHAAKPGAGAIILPGDKCWSGLKRTEALPTTGYMLEAEVRRVERDGDFFYVVFPADREQCMFVVGGWRGGVVGLDLVDGVRADANGTRTNAKFEIAQWYSIRLLVTSKEVQAWVGNEKVVDLKRAGHELSLSPEFVPAAPFAICATEVETAVRNIRLRRVESGAAEAPAPAEAPAVAELEQGLLAVYYKGSNMERFVTAQPWSGVLNVNWGPNAPLPELPADNFSARFVGWLKIDEAGKYTFQFTVHDDGARLYLDGKKVIDEWGVAAQGQPHTVALAKGLHRLWVEYTEGIGMAALVLDWHEGGKPVHVPADRFYCERKLLDAARQNPTRNPLLGMKPTDRVRPPQPEPPPKEGAGQGQGLFDGKTLEGWKVAEGGDYEGHGEVEAAAGQLVLGAGKLFTGVACTRDVPTEDYEVSYETRRVAGTDMFGALVLPVGEQCVQFTVGGWGGSIVSLHWVDDKPGCENPTTRRMEFVNGRWYRVRVRVSKTRIEGWIDEQKVVDFPREGHKFSVDAHNLPLRPLGFQTARTKGAFRNIRIRRIEP